MEYVIGCDIGSQGVKAVLLNADGDLAAEASSDYAIDYPSPTWAEQPPERWVQAACKSVSRLVAQSGVPPGSIRALGLASQVDGLVAMDASGSPLHPAIIWMDRRAVAQCEQAKERITPQELFNLSGLNLDATHVAPKIRWLADHHPELYAKAARFLLPGSYMAYYLTGELGVDYSNASSSLLMDVRRKEWSAQLCKVFDIDPSRLAPMYPATAVLGKLRPSVAAAMGLTAETRVVLGSGDEHAACLGAGVTRPGLVGDISGTAEPVGAASASPTFDPSGLVETHCHADPDLWLLENPGFVSGANYRWFRDQFGHEELSLVGTDHHRAYELLDEQASSIPPGSEGLLLLPCLMGAMAPTWNSLARGVFFGFTLAHTRAHFARAILEGSAYAVRDITDQMQAIGLALDEVRVVGGGARSRLWRQIKADVTGLPVALPQTVETTALGAAMMALVGGGFFASLAETAGKTVRIVETIDPRSELKQRYDDCYHLYRSTYQALLPVFEQAACATT